MSRRADTAGSMIDDAINGGFRGTFIIKGGQERGGDIVDVFRGLGLDWGFRFGRGCLQGGGVSHFFEIARTVGWSSRNFSRMAAVCEFGDRRPSSQLRSEAKVAWK